MTLDMTYSRQVNFSIVGPCVTLHLCCLPPSYVEPACIWLAAAAIVVIIVKRVEKLPSHDIICTDRPAHKSIL
jgi:hypothetical protein